MIYHCGTNGGVCYEILFFIHSVAVGGFPPGEVVEFDREGVLGHLESVLASVRFIHQ
jgi:hypothetical protein